MTVQGCFKLKVEEKGTLENLIMSMGSLDSLFLLLLFSESLRTKSVTKCTQSIQNSHHLPSSLSLYNLMKRYFELTSQISLGLNIVVNI